MSLIDPLNNDLLALIAQCLPVKELLYFIRSHRRLHSLNSSNSSWSSRFWLNSQIKINLNTDGARDHFLSWLMRNEKYVYDSGESATNQHRRRGLISLTTWDSIKSVVIEVWQRWLDDMNKNGCLYSNKKSIQMMNFDQLNHIIQMRDNPATRIITTNSGEQCEVLTELNHQQLDNEYGRFSSLCYYPQFILSATPQLRSLSLTVDPDTIELPDASEIFSLVPHLQSLSFCQYNESEDPLISVRQTLKCLPELESLALMFLHPTIQSMIDIAAHPRLTHIELDDCGEFYPAELDTDWFGYDESFISYDDSEELEEEEEEENDEVEKTLNNSAQQQFHIDRDKDYGGDQVECEEAEPERMAEDLDYIQSSLLLPTTAASIKARLLYLNWLISILFKPKHAKWNRPLRYLRHLRHQIFIIHTSLTQSLNNVSNNPVIYLTDTVDNDENKRRRLKSLN